VLTLLALFFTGCVASTNPGGSAADRTNPYRSVHGVLVIAGEGLNSTYDDISASGVLFTISVKASESLYDEIVRAGTPAQWYVNRDKAAEPVSYIGPLILKNKRDGLAQVFVQSKKTGMKTLYISR
jgi:hypothetical protein